MAVICGGQGDRQKASSLLAEAQEVYKNIGDAMLGEMIIGDSAWDLWRQGELRKGRAMMEDHLSSQRKAHFKWAASGALANLVYMNLAMGDFAAAQSYADENLNVRVTSNVSLMGAVETRGIVDLALGNLEQAESRLCTALEIARKLQERKWIAGALNWLGLAFVLKGDIEEGIVRLEESQEICRGFENQKVVAVLENLYSLGFASNRLGDFAQAARYLGRSIEVWQLNSLPRIPALMEELAASAFGLGRFRDGVVLLAAADQQRRTMGASRWPVVQPDHEKLISSLKANLDELEFQSAWEAGEGLTVEQSVEFVRAIVASE